jgi:hypothetical protein
MAASTPSARFMANNFVGADVSLSATSAASGYPLTNVYDPDRSVPWKAAGHFKITSANSAFYFNDGSARTANVTPGNYTAATLATAIAAAAVSSGATATVVASAYSTAPYVWQLVFSTSVTLSLNTTTNAIWDTLGFTGTTARSGTSFRADAARAHTHEQITIGIGIPIAPTFLAAIAPVDEVFGASNSATYTLMGNNVDSWDSPPVSVSLTLNDAGVFAFIDSLANSTYEFWALKIVDREHVSGTAGVRIGHLYLGDHITFTTANVGVGWSKLQADPSMISQSRSGKRFSNRKPKKRVFEGLTSRYVVADERREFEQMIYDVGIDTPFYASLDPMLLQCDDLAEWTVYGHMTNGTRSLHILRDLFSITVEIEEEV